MHFSSINLSNMRFLQKTLGHILVMAWSGTLDRTESMEGGGRTTLANTYSGLGVQAKTEMLWLF